MFSIEKNLPRASSDTLGLNRPIMFSNLVIESMNLESDPPNNKPSNDFTKDGNAVVNPIVAFIHPIAEPIGVKYGASMSAVLAIVLPILFSKLSESNTSTYLFHHDPSTVMISVHFTIS
jgi:hypothetical protein